MQVFEKIPSNYAIFLHFLENFRILSQISREISEFWKQCINFVLQKMRILEKKYTPMRIIVIEIENIVYV